MIRRNHKTGEVSLNPLRWGLIPYWCEDQKGGRKPINAKRETVRTLPSFREAYHKRRCILPVDGFFEWRPSKARRPRIGKAKAVTDTARKVAVLFYNAVRHGMEYVDPGASSYETRYRTRVVNNLHRRAKAFGFVLQPLEPKAGAVVS